MPRVKLTPQEAGAAIVHKASAEAATVLLSQLESCNDAMQSCLAAAVSAREARDSDENYYFNMAIKLAGISARLAEAIAKTKGETAQHIRVERDRIKEEGATRSSVPNVPKNT